MRGAHDNSRPFEEVVSPDLLRELLAYDPATGLLTWLEREPRHFADNPRLTPEQHCEMWNRRYAKRRAFTTLVCQRGYKAFRGMIFHRSVQASRIAWAVYYGRWPGSFIDHINGDATDNRIMNLRDTSPAGNSRNMCRNTLNSSGYAGVTWKASAQRWEAFIDRDNRTIFLGQFDDLSCAVAARQGAERALNYSSDHGKRDRTSGRYLAEIERVTVPHTIGDAA